MTQKLRKIHSVTLCAIYSHTFLAKNFVKVTVSLKKFTLTEKIFRQINTLVTSLVKPLLSRNFCHKSGAVQKFREINVFITQLFTR